MAEAEVELLTEIRDLLMVLAEPQLAERDRVMRSELLRIVGRSEKNRKAVLLMDGSRNQAAIVKQVPIDSGNLSTLVKEMRQAKLLKPGANPDLVIRVTASAFDESRK
jgi:hypothetical protein